MGSEEIVSFLMEKGADPGDMSTSGFTPLIVASAGGHLGTSTPLLPQDAPGHPPLPRPSTSSHVPLPLSASPGVVKKLLAAKVDVNAEHPEGVSALMYASAGGHLPVVTLLIDNGAEVRHHHPHRHTCEQRSGVNPAEIKLEVAPRPLSEGMRSSACVIAGF